MPELVICYDAERFNFAKIVSQLFSVEDLTKLHDHLETGYVAPDGVAGLSNDTHSKFHKLFYNKLNSGWKEFNDMYVSFVKDVISKQISNEKNLIYQALPSFRIQYPNGKAVTTLHYDHDKNHKHPIGELNIFVPITETTDSNTIYIESLPGLGNFGPIILEPGRCMLWNGNMCRHYNKVNTSNKTRVSFDFRIISSAFYDPNYPHVTATTTKRFVVGEYYSQL